MPATAPNRETIAAIRAEIAQGDVRAGPVLPFDVDAIDERLAGRGLAAHAVHEVAAATSSLSDDAAATLFIAGIAARFAAADGATIVWAVTRFDLYAPGLEQAGLPPSKMLHVEAREDHDVLALVEDAVRNGSLAAVVGEVKRASMTATRRLQLAASEGRTPVLLLRRWRRAAACPMSEPSAAATRWRIACAPSARLPMPGVGRPRWSVELARQRGGVSFSTIVEGCDATGRLAPPATVLDRAAPAGGAIIHQAA